MKNLLLYKHYKLGCYLFAAAIKCILMFLQKMLKKGRR